MKWFDRWFLKHSRKAWENSKNEIGATAGSPYQNDVPIRATIRPSYDLDTRQTSTIRIHDAHGGKVVEVSSYDEQRDRHDRDLYIISEGKVMGDELASIIMQHNLRN